MTAAYQALLHFLQWEQGIWKRIAPSKISAPIEKLKAIVLHEWEDLKQYASSKYNGFWDAFESVALPNRDYQNWDLTSLGHYKSKTNELLDIFRFLCSDLCIRFLGMPHLLLHSHTRILCTNLTSASLVGSRNRSAMWPSPRMP